MRLRVLGCHGAELPNHSACGFLINGSVLLDAGTISSAMTLAEQSNIRYILISHIHADHTMGLTFLSENLIAVKRQRTVVIISIEEVLAGLRQNLPAVWLARMLPSIFPNLHPANGPPIPRAASRPAAIGLPRGCSWTFF